MIKNWKKFNESNKVDKIDEDEFLGQDKLEKFVNQNFINSVLVPVLKYEDNVYDELAKEIHEFKKEYLKEEPWTNGYLYWIEIILRGDRRAFNNKFRPYGETIYVINKIIEFYNTIIDKAGLDEQGYPINKRLKEIHHIIESSLDEDNILEFGDYYETKSGSIIQFYTKSQLSTDDLQKVNDEIKMIEGRIEEFNLKIYDIGISTVRSKDGSHPDYKMVICCLK